MDITSITDLHIPLHVLKQTTEQFSHSRMIGRGGYAMVYKGVYNGEEIAVKLFYDVLTLDNKQFENEVVNHMRIKHPNVVSLVGYCYETQHKLVKHKEHPQFAQHIYRILCFEYLQGGSLDKYLKESRDHDWPIRYNIIKGICEGLYFLHEGCGSQILHLDLKPANILLDNNMRAKVADFGLSRFFNKTHTHVTDTIIGTTDYMPPEFKSNGQISAKNDVYSFGIIIIEIMAGRTGYSEFREMCDVTPFIERVITNWREWINETTSPCPSAESNQVETCIKIAINCVDHERKNRPTVAEILDILKETEKTFPEENRNLMGQSLRTPTKSGPWGGSAGTARDIKEKPWRLESLTIGYLGLVDAFSFSYIDQVGNKQTLGPWGEGYSGDKIETICFGPSEFLEEVWVAYGSHFENVLVMSLTFVTNVKTYGPFGNPYHQNVPATHFRFMADEDSSVVGFHGRSGTHLYSIGVYTCPSNKTTVRALPALLIHMGQSLPTPIKSGPWGGSAGTARDIEKPWRLKSLTISYLGLVDAFSFSYIDQEGKKRSSGHWGQGYHYDEIETILFDPSEFVQEVSGAYGNHDDNILVTSLKFVTNAGTYGPFGNPHHQNVPATPFRFRAEEGSKIVGFHGRSCCSLNAIGVYTMQITEL